MPFAWASFAGRDRNLALVPISVMPAYWTCHVVDIARAELVVGLERERTYRLVESFAQADVDTLHS